MKNKTRKLTAIIMLAITTLLCFSVFSACGEEKYIYKVEMLYTVQAGEIYENNETLLSDNPTIDYEFPLLYGDTFHFRVDRFCVKKYYKDKYDSLGGLVCVETVAKLFPWPNIDVTQTILDKEETREISIVPEYKITDQNGAERNGQLRPDNYLGYKEEIHLEETEGIHTLKYKFPKWEIYGIEETEFIITFNALPDPRLDRVVIDAEPSDDEVTYTKITAKDENEYDMYVVKGNKIPKFTARLKESPNENLVLEETEGIIVGYLTPGENEGKLVEGGYLDKGVYLCSVYFRGGDRYRRVRYWCYIVIQG